MEARQIQVLLEQADVQRGLGNHRGAIELVQRALALDPDHAVAHASLAVALLGARRLPGALIEVRAAMHLDGNDPYVHYVAALVLRAARKLDDAWAHCLIALEDPAVRPGYFVLGAQIQVLRGDRARARELLAEALALDADHTDALTALAQLELHSGALDAAAAQIVRALESDPSDRDAHTVAGHIDLARGDLAGAEQHARFVLNQDGNDPDGLGLWIAIKARRSKLLGAWWRLNSFLTLRDDTRRIAALIGSFLVARVLIIVTDELGYPGLSRMLHLAWIALCAYTWFAPVLFRRWLAQELRAVRLDPDF
jgi:tetratricopeptide (TPR) repeat protein